MFLSLFLIEWDLVDQINGIISLNPYFSSLLRIIRHFQLLSLTPQDRVSHRFQAIQFLYNFLTWSVLHAHPTLGFTWKVLLFIGALTCCIIDSKTWSLIWRFSFTIRDTRQRTFTQLIVDYPVDDVLETLVKDSLLLRSTLHSYRLQISCLASWLAIWIKIAFQVTSFLFERICLKWTRVNFLEDCCISLGKSTLR